ncbi:MAG TPA: hypothetical protein VFB42_12875 [Gaiellaceae bacterium]|nr:hypothetical protein [Gaiellaceae bacterium]
MKLRLALALLAASAASAVAVAGAAAGRPHDHGRLFAFSGELLAAPGPGATSVSVRVERGNRAALHALLGSSQNQVFALGPGTEILLWSHGVPHAGGTGELRRGDYVTVRIRAPRGSTLRQVESTPAATVAAHAAPNGGLPLWLFVGAVAGPQSGGRVALHVESGNWKALHALLGQPLDQSFAYDDGTVFLLWQGRVPTVIDASQLRAGDRITIRIRAPRSYSLAQVEATPAARVGDHEPPPPPQE